MKLDKLTKIDLWLRHKAYTLKSIAKAYANG